MQSHCDLSIIIVSFNVREYLLACIASIIKNIAGVAFEIIVVDNASTDGSVEAVRTAYPEVSIITKEQNVGFAGANNQGYEKSTGDFILLLNPDTEIKQETIQTVLSFLKNEPSAGIAGCRNIGPNGTLQKSITPFPTVLRNCAQALFIDRFLLPARKKATYYRPSPFKVDSVGGAFMMIRRAALNNGPLLNTDYFMYSEEKDLALRLKRAGWSTWFVPGAEIIHHGGRSTDQVPVAMFIELHKSQIRYFKTFYSRLHALALCFSWWLVLCSGAVASLPFCFSQKGRNRFRLFIRASWVFPFLVLFDGKGRQLNPL